MKTPADREIVIETLEPHVVSAPSAMVDPNSDTSTHLRLPLLLGSLTAVLYMIGSDRSYTHDGGTTVLFHIKDLPIYSALSGSDYNNHPLASLLGQIVWRLGGTSEVAQRLIPALAAAASIAIIAWIVSQVWDRWMGLSAALIVAMNPMFIENSRAVRGYSLMIFGAVLATALLYQAEAGGALQKRRWSTIGYALAVGIAISGHAYGGAVVIAHVAYLLAAGRFSWAWARGVVGGLFLGALVYAPMLIVLLEGNGRRFQVFFPIQVALRLTGVTTVSFIVLWVAAIFGFRTLRQNQPVLIGIAAVALVYATLWLVVAPYDLYPRMTLVLLPAFATIVSLGMRPLGRLAPAVIFVVMGVGAVDLVPSWTTDPMANRVVAELADQAAARGESVCGFGWITNSIRIYTPAVSMREEPLSISDCDFVIATPRDGSHGEALKPYASSVYPVNNKWHVTVYERNAQEATASTTP